jgi:cytidine deaminase
VGDALIDAARGAQSRAYAPYSRFLVGAALESEDGRVFTGCNVENASYGLTNCAERVALGTAISAGARKFRRMVVASDAEPPSAPCGACRQVLAEFGESLVVESVSPRTSRTWKLSELLPSSFGPGDLDR